MKDHVFIKKNIFTSVMFGAEFLFVHFENVSHQKQLDRPTNQEKEILETAMVLFRELWNREPVRLLGIRSSKLAEEGEPEQLSLFDLEIEPEEKRRKRRQMEAAMEKLRGKYGKDVIRKGPGY